MVDIHCRDRRYKWDGAIMGTYRSCGCDWRGTCLVLAQRYWYGMDWHRALDESTRWISPVSHCPCSPAELPWTKLPSQGQASTLCPPDEDSLYVSSCPSGRGSTRRSLSATCCQFWYTVWSCLDNLVQCPCAVSPAGALPTSDEFPLLRSNNTTPDTSLAFIYDNSFTNRSHTCLYSRDVKRASIYRCSNLKPMSDSASR